MSRKKQDDDLPHENRQRIDELEKEAHERQIKEAELRGEKRGSAKIRKAVCIVSASVATGGITFLHWLGGFILDKYSAIQSAWDAFIKAGGLNK